MTNVKERDFIFQGQLSDAALTRTKPEFSGKEPDYRTDITCVVPAQNVMNRSDLALLFGRSLVILLTRS